MARAPGVARGAGRHARTTSCPRVSASLRRRAVLGTVVLLSAVPFLVSGLDKTRDARDLTGDLGWVAIGALLVLFGVVILLATFAGPVAGVIGRVGECAA